MDGAAALGFARSRMSEGETDFTRAARQQQLLAAIAEKLSAGNLLVTLPGLLDAVKQNVATDIPSSRMSAIAAEVEEADLDGIERTVLTPDDGYVVVEPFSEVGYILHPNLDAIRALGDQVFDSASAGVR
jgi:anionic cell wall polymer biosynthesis LytR-Cps2A-Psr (LCP) family protein